MQRQQYSIMISCSPGVSLTIGPSIHGANITFNRIKIIFKIARIIEQNCSTLCVHNSHIPKKIVLGEIVVGWLRSYLNRSLVPISWTIKDKVKAHTKETRKNQINNCSNGKKGKFSCGIWYHHPPKPTKWLDQRKHYERIFIKVFELSKRKTRLM